MIRWPQAIIKIDDILAVDPGFPDALLRLKLTKDRHDFRRDHQTNRMPISAN